MMSFIRCLVILWFLWFATYGYAADVTITTGGTGTLTIGSADGGGSGDITEVIAGDGLTGGATSGSATLNVAAGTGITVNPNDVALTTPVTVANGGTGATTLTDGGILLGKGTSAITALGVATNGQIPIGDGTTDPLLATITGTADEITVTNGAGSITIDIPDPLIVGKGGTGAASLTDGGILLGSGTGAITPLGVATNGQIPIGDGTTDPVLAAITESTALDVTNGAGSITILWDSTEVEAVTWGAGGNASNLWTFNLSGTDPTLNWVSGGATLVGTFTADALTLGAEENLTLGSSTIQEDTTTTDVTIGNDVDIEDATPHLRWTDTTASSDDFESYADANSWYLTNVTDAVVIFQVNPFNNIVSARTLDLGDGGLQIPNSTSLPGSCTVGEVFLDTDATSGQRLYGCEGGAFVLQGDGGGGGAGDITDIGDCAGPTCFSGTSGTTLNFEGDGGTNFSFLYDTVDDDFEITDDLTIEELTPHLRLTDTSPSQDDFEIYAEGNEFYLSNVTDGKVHIQITSGDRIRFPQVTNCNSLKIDANGEVSCGSYSKKEFWWSCSGTEPLEATDSISPISKITGTNVDVMVCSFDASTDEGRKVSFKVPSDVTASGTVTFRIVWFSQTATTGNVIWDFRSTSTGTEGESWDGSLTTLSSGTDAVQGTVNQMTVTTVTQTVSTLGWVANDVITTMIYRDANASGDNMAGDAEVVGIGIEIPRS